MIQELQEDGLGDHFHADELRSEVDADVRSRMSSMIQSASGASGNPNITIAYRRYESESESSVEIHIII
jgi:hypothetical protein